MGVLISIEIHSSLIRKLQNNAHEILQKFSFIEKVWE